MSAESRIDALERRVAALEDARATHPPAAGKAEAREDYWALQRLREDLPDGGAVLFTGDVTLPTGAHWAWQEAAGASSLIEEDWAPVSAVLGALDHPIRLALLQAVLQGRTTVTELADLEGLGTSGQLYHHLRGLVSAGWLASSGRGQYVVPGQRVVPLLVIVSAARPPR